jgi:addiction module HigA family antidote
LKENQKMEMKNPPHPGGLISDTLDQLSISVTEAARGLGVTRQQLHNVIAGRSGITPEMAVKLEKAIGSTADTWLRMQMSYDLAKVRKRAIKVKRLIPA